MRRILFLSAGALFSLSCFTFADGFIAARRIGLPYNFLMWLPAIMIVTGMLIFRITDAKAVIGTDNFLDDVRVPREKVLFFIGACLTVGGFAVSLWKAVDPYSNASEATPGVLLVAQSVFLALCSGILFSVRVLTEDDWF
ncbi:hypothetical protein TraAM80_06162 [Trypanosoma rangeli]|uniref:Uncharacterized protein n=1 Tax=Trypanosoma rangeli TaxID=5698 RepID=A0A422NBE9_TRYRA|nr:uncharacterized protein TraAM80_06162 [Trypanosoma rangeli]RNF02810.1 hypothetical protein TraAM80_06162 [Trypanosoma rangeli]|eukprot:RNF02810.1 hypothetical protein TraAM80_06162 [Trypanosoma rangeli]